ALIGRGCSPGTLVTRFRFVLVIALPRGIGGFLLALIGRGGLRGVGLVGFGPPILLGLLRFHRGLDGCVLFWFHRGRRRGRLDRGRCVDRIPGRVRLTVTPEEKPAHHSTDDEDGGDDGGQHHGDSDGPPGIRFLCQSRGITTLTWRDNGLICGLVGSVIVDFGDRAHHGGGGRAGETRGRGRGSGTGVRTNHRSGVSDLTGRARPVRRVLPKQGRDQLVHVGGDVCGKLRWFFSGVRECQRDRTVTGERWLSRQALVGDHPQGVQVGCRGGGASRGLLG